jgi:hypothetical protein
MNTMTPDTTASSHAKGRRSVPGIGVGADGATSAGGPERGRDDLEAGGELAEELPVDLDEHGLPPHRPRDDDLAGVGPDLRVMEVSAGVDVTGQPEHLDAPEIPEGREFQMPGVEARVGRDHHAATEIAPLRDGRGDDALNPKVPLIHHHVHVHVFPVEHRAEGAAEVGRLPAQRLQRGHIAIDEAPPLALEGPNDLTGEPEGRDVVEDPDAQRGRPRLAEEGDAADVERHRAAPLQRRQRRVEVADPDRLSEVAARAAPEEREGGLGGGRDARDRVDETVDHLIDCAVAAADDDTLDAVFQCRARQLRRVPRPVGERELEGPDGILEGVLEAPERVGHGPRARSLVDDDEGPRPSRRVGCVHAAAPSPTTASATTDTA